METIFDKVPIKATKKRGAKPKYRFDLMQKDDSFFAPNITKSGLVSAAFNWAKRNNSKFKFIVREDEKDGVNGMRIWRVK